MLVDLCCIGKDAADGVQRIQAATHITRAATSPREVFKAAILAASAAILAAHYVARNIMKRYVTGPVM